MSINLKISIDAYTKLLSSFVDDIYLESTLSDFEKLELLSNLLNSFRLIQKHFPISKLKLSSITLKKFDIEDDFYSNKHKENTKDLIISLDLNEKDYFNTIIHNLGAFIYYSILNKEDENLNRKVSSFCEKIMDNIIEEYDERLDDLVLINDNNQNLLNYLTRGNELFARAFKNYILYSNIKNYKKQFLDLSYEQYLEYKGYLTDILNSYTRYFDKNNASKDEFNLSDIEKENILKNENRLKNKNLSKIKIDDNLEDFDYENSDNLYLNLLEFYKDSIEDMEKSFDFSFIFNEDLDNSLYDLDNTLNIKEDVSFMDSSEICNLEDELEEDIMNLTEEMSILEGQINIYKTKGLADKKKNTILENLIMHMFFLSQEQRTKILLKKSLESADITYTNKHIKHSEKHNKVKGAVNLIKNEPVKVRLDIPEIRKKLIKIYGLEFEDIVDSSLKNMSASALVNVTIKDKKKRKSKDKSKDPKKDINNLEMQIEEKDKEKEKNDNSISIKSSELIDSLLKRRLNSIYTNSSSKFKNRDYRRLKTSEKLTGLNITSSKADYLFSKLIEDTEKITKKKAEREIKEKEEAKKEKAIENSLDDLEF